jgi:hypothetical protein
MFGCHFGEILFQSSIVLDNKQDASSMTFSLSILLWKTCYEGENF